VDLDLPESFHAVVVGSATLVARPGSSAFAWEAIERSGTLHDFAAAYPGAVRLEGRGAAWRIAGPGGDWVVRHYRRGGAVARWLGDRYLRLGEPRPLRELRASEAVRARGIETPEVLAAAIYPAGVFYRGDIAVRYVPASRDLAAVLFGTEAVEAERCAAMEAAGRLVRALHEAGVVHPDLNLKNVLIAGPASAPRAILLDLDRCAAGDGVGAGGRARMIARFHRSLAKWERRTGRRVAEAVRAAFRHGYEEGAMAAQSIDDA